MTSPRGHAQITSCEPFDYTPAGSALDRTTGADLFAGKPGAGNLTRYVLEQRGGAGQVASAVTTVVGANALLVIKAEFFAGNDRFTLYVNPLPGQPEPASGVVKNDIDVGTVSGVNLYSTGAFAVDELRTGPTYASVTQVTQTTLTVINTADSGPGSLRQAILDANACPGTNIIQFTPSAYGTILLTSGELLITDHLFINGPGATSVAVDGNAASRVFHIVPSKTVTLSSLTITNGSSQGIFFGGGGIWNEHGTLTVSNCSLRGNSAYSGGGGILNDGSAGSATLTVFNSTLSGNSGGSQGGGIWNEGEESGGSATLTVVNSTLSGNRALFAGGIFNNVFNRGTGNALIVNCTLRGNSAFFVGGGIGNNVFNGGQSSLQILNSTLSGNSATENGGGIDNSIDVGSASSLRIVNSTLSGNSASAGGGINNNGPRATLQIGSTILNTGASGGSIFNNGGTVTSLGYNLSSDDGGGVLTNATGDQINTDPMLGPLQDNGGPTFTHAFLCRSPAIDRGKNFSASATAQRGVGFARIFDDPAAPNATDGDGTDIGAFEAQQPLPDCNQPPGAVIQVSPLANFPGITNLIVIAANNSNACVTLDGSLSSDPDNDALTYLWFNEPSPLQFASGVTATDCLGVGTHTILLVVTDTHGASGTAAVTVEVISPCTGVGIAIDCINNTGLPRNRVRPPLASLKAACASFEEGKAIPALNQLQAFQNKVQAQVAPIDATLAQKLIDTAQAIIDALGGP